MVTIVIKYFLVNDGMLLNNSLILSSNLYTLIIFTVCGTNLDMNAGSCVCAADFYQTEIINEVPQCTACPAGSTRAITDAATIDGCGM